MQIWSGVLSSHETYLVWISSGQCFSNIINYSLFKSETEFTLFSKTGPARFPWFNCIFFVCWQWKAEENTLAKEMKYDQEKQAFSHCMRRGVCVFFHIQFFIRKKVSTLWNNSTIAVTVRSYLHSQKKMLERKLTSS